MIFMETTMILIICELIGGLIGGLIGYLLTKIIGYLLTKIKRVNEKAEWQYVQAKLSNVETNLSLVEYLLKGIRK